MLKWLSKIYYSKWFPRFFYKKYDGGKESGVVGYFLIEWKILFSIGLLRFSKGSREAFHSHAFNAISWWLSGSVTEERLIDVDETDNRTNKTLHCTYKLKSFEPSLKPKYTPRNNVHRVVANEKTWALTFRGPWEDEWLEFNPNHTDKPKITVFTHGRKEVK